MSEDTALRRQAATLVADAQSRAAMMQNPREIEDLTHLLLKQPRHRRRQCLELGLAYGGTHHLLASLYDRVYSVEMDRTCVARFVHQAPENGLVLCGNTHDAWVYQAIKRMVGTVDLLFIDANHEYPHVLSDYLVYDTLVPVGGIIVWHDSVAMGPGFGVKTMLDQLRKNGLPIRDLVHSPYGLSYLVKREDAPQRTVAVTSTGLSVMRARGTEPVVMSAMEAGEVVTCVSDF